MVRPGNAIQTFQPILPYRQTGSPFIRLTGDEFCGTAESSLYLLENVNSAIGGTALTNNGTTTFSLDTAYGNTVAVLNGSTQYLSLPTESSVQVGTGSFMVSIWFKTTAIGVTQCLFSYGSFVSGKQRYALYLNTGNILIAEINDGTNDVFISDPIGGRWNDGIWHCAEMFVDRTSNIMYIICDGVFIASGSISTVTGTLNVAGENFYVGALKGTGGTVVNEFNGSLANFHLIKAADYNAIGVLNTGIREQVNGGTGLTVGSDSGGVLNTFTQQNVNGAWITCLINTEAGIYEFQEKYIVTASSGIEETYIDNLLISSIDKYNSGTVYNKINKTYGVKLTEGQHVLKLKVNSHNGSSGGFNSYFQFINIIKRQGHEEGGVDNFWLLGDEITERGNNSFGTSNTDSSEYYNNASSSLSSQSNGNYTEGTLFIKGGLYRIDFDYQLYIDQGKVDLWFGNVQVLSQFDEYSGSLGRNQNTNVNVRLQQGKNVIRIAVNGKNGISSDYRVNFVTIRGVRLSD